MNVITLTLTRDRLPYTVRCFAALRELAGIPFKHYILDQGSADGTPDWLESERKQRRLDGVVLSPDNIGIAAGINHLLDSYRRELAAADVVVKFDNDALLETPGALRVACEVALARNALVSPRVNGLDNPPAEAAAPVAANLLDGKAVLATPMHQIGGIFTAYPAAFLQSWRWPEDDLPAWGRDDDLACKRAHLLGMETLYLEGFFVEHVETTAGQHRRFPDYFARRENEGGPP